MSPATLLNRDSNTVVFLWICEIFKNIYFEEHLRTAASESLIHAVFPVHCFNNPYVY